MPERKEQARSPEEIEIPKKHTGAELEQYYLDAETADSDKWAEMRSNVLLINGQHYNKKHSEYYRRIRSSKELTESQKLRLTKNHTQRIVKSYCNTIIGAAPGVGFRPKNKNELQDMKAAQLHHAVYLDAKYRYNLDELHDEFCDDYVGLGECAEKIFYDPEYGEIKAYEQKVDDDGNPVFDNLGNMVADPSMPVFRGGFVFERIFGFNLFRPKEAQSFKEAEWIGIRKMVSKDLAMLRWGKDEEVQKAIAAESEQTFKVFDASHEEGYRDCSDEVMIKEFYFRPGPLYPRGYYYFTINSKIVESGELPGGIFPINIQTFETSQTAPRGIGPVKVIKPFQAEINRGASMLAQHQTTVGDDKILFHHGSKLTQGKALSGIRAYGYTGMEPKILPGRDGSQFLPSMQATITEMYNVLQVDEHEGEDKIANLEPTTVLYRAANRKRRLSRNIKRFERFLIEEAKLFLRLAKHHLPDDEFIQAVGRSEAINIAEFKNSTDINYEIMVEAQSDDIETKMGQQMVMDKIMQFGGPNLEREDVGKLIRAMPFAQKDELFNDLTLDYDSVTNDILALDRGEQPPVSPFDNIPYAIRRLVSRMRQADFKTLHAQIQQNYQARVQQYEQLHAQQIQQTQALKDGFIPVDGPLVVVDFYVRDPKDPAKTKRAKVPHNAILWLMDKLNAQGSDMETLERMNQGAVAQIAQQMQLARPGGAEIPQLGGQANVGQSGQPSLGAGEPIAGRFGIGV